MDRLLWQHEVPDKLEPEPAFGKGQPAEPWFAKTEEPWKLKPGSNGFNRYARRRIRRALHGFNATHCPDPESKEFRPQPHQRVIAYLAAPPSPCTRMLVSARVGSGKTYTMVLVLNALFDDPRPKVVLVPTRPLVANFYQSVLKFPSKYRDYVMHKHGSKPKPPTWQEAKDILALKGQRLAGRTHDSSRPAPLRCFGFTAAGGSAAFGKNPDPIFKRGGSGRKNPYDETIIVADEIHLLTRPPPDRKKYHKQHARLINAIHTGHNTAFFGFTGTVYDKILNDARVLLDLVKGVHGASRSDEGYLSHYSSMDTAVYPEVTGTGNPELKLPTVVSGPMSGQTLQNYLLKEREMLKKYSDPVKMMRALSPYCTASRSYRAMNAAWIKQAKRNPVSYATKIAALAKYLNQNNTTIGNGLVMIHRKNGFKAVAEIVGYALSMRMCTTSPGNNNDEHNSAWCMSLFTKGGKLPKRKQDTVNAHQLKQFNDYDATGKHHRLAVADSADFGTGVSFLGVRTFVLLDVPSDATEYVQVAGRALRMCGHNRFPEDQRNVNMVMFASTLPPSHPRLSADDFGILYLQETLKYRVSIERKLASIAIETSK